MTRRKRMLADSSSRTFATISSRETQDNIDRGMSPEDTPVDAGAAQVRKRRASQRGNLGSAWNIVWLEQLLQDVRFGVRTLLRSPGLTVAAVMAIALGIGINVGIFSVLNGLALRLLPVRVRARTGGA